VTTGCRWPTRRRPTPCPRRSETAPSKWCSPLSPNRPLSPPGSQIPGAAGRDGRRCGPPPRSHPAPVLARGDGPGCYLDLAIGPPVGAPSRTASDDDGGAASGCGDLLLHRQVDRAAWRPARRSHMPAVRCRHR